MSNEDSEIHAALVRRREALAALGLAGIGAVLSAGTAASRSARRKRPRPERAASTPR